MKNTSDIPKILIPTIIGADKMTPGMARYWHAKARDLAGKVKFIDPWRHTVRWLKENITDGGVVYRASTGGRWGKSAQIVTI